MDYCYPIDKTSPIQWAASLADHCQKLIREAQRGAPAKSSGTPRGNIDLTKLSSTPTIHKAQKSSSNYFFFIHLLPAIYGHNHVMTTACRTLLGRWMLGTR